MSTGTFTIVSCDRCDAEIEPVTDEDGDTVSAGGFFLTSSGPVRDGDPTSVDLCDGCLAELAAWWKCADGEPPT